MKRVTSILFLLSLCFSAYSQDKSQVNGGADQRSQMVEINFDLNKYVVDLEWDDNRSKLDYLTHLINELLSDPRVTVSDIQINSYASPESGYHYNQKLTERRTNSIYKFLKETTSAPDNLITKSHSGIDWDGLYALVEESDMKYRDDVLRVIKNTTEETWSKINPTDKWLSLVDSRNKHLMELKFGRPYRYMAANFFPQLRSGSVVTIYFKRELQPIVEPQNMVATIARFEQLQSQETKPELAKKTELVAEPEPEALIKPLFAVKTNLLFDAATLLNVEAEVPIGDRWSVAGEWVFPWWTWDDGTAQSSRNRIQLLQGNLMGKYWFGDRASQPQLTGWFAGVYAGAGLYDFERNKNGVQGEFFIAGGLAGGYAHTINKSGNLRMEYSLGVGYLQTDYRRYTSDYYGENDWRAIRTSTGKYSWFGPTQVKVSLVWMLNRKTKRGGVR